MIGAVTAGWWSSQASATSAGSSPSSAHSDSHASSLSRLSLDQGLDALAGATALGDLAQRPAQQASAERAPRDDADPVRLTRRQHLELDHAGVEVVEALLRHQPQRAPPPGGLVGLHHVPAGEVRAADVQHLALGDQQVHRLPDLVPRGVTVDVVHLVEVDVVGLQAPQAVVARLTDVQRRQLRRVRPLVATAVDLGREHGLLPPATALREPPADDLLGLGAAVDVGGVEEVHARLERRVHQLVARRLVGVGAEVHRAEAQGADAEAGAAEEAVIHAGNLPRPRRPSDRRVLAIAWTRSTRP